MIASTQTNHPLQANLNAEENLQNRVSAAAKLLRLSGLRITQPRLGILRTMMVRNQPMSIEQIHAELNIRSCDLVTVYRCLAAFEEIGLVRRSFFHNGTSLYQLNDGARVPYHVIDKENRQIRDLDPELSEKLESAIRVIEDQLRAEGYESVSHVLEFFVRSPHSSPDLRVERSGEELVKSAKL